MIAGELTTSSTETSKRFSDVFPRYNPSALAGSGGFSNFRGTEAMIYRFFARQVTGVCAAASFLHATN